MADYEHTADGARQLRADIPKLLKASLEKAPRDFCALECLANDPLYAKPDAEKIFVIWEARNAGGIVIDKVSDATERHPWLMQLFVSPDSVRFPFNTWDTEAQANSLSWVTIRPEYKWERCRLLIALKDSEIPHQGENLIVLCLNPQAKVRFLVFDRAGAKVVDQSEDALLEQAQQIRTLKLQVNKICFSDHQWTDARREALTEIEENSITGSIAAMFPNVPFLATNPSGDASGALLQLARWSTASRSCLVLVPEDETTLPHIALANIDFGNRFNIERSLSGPNPNVPEWQPAALQRNRFHETVKNPGMASQSSGVWMRGGKVRLYSLKTGVSFVGSKDERAKKARLEESCFMAMRRSECIEAMHNNDTSFGVQTEVLTITAPIIDFEGDGGESRDGFQVRDLSCMRRDLDYIPGQAIPYARQHFDEDEVDANAGVDKQAADQCAFWRKAFAVPLGRAKARLFLNYGLIHQSANAQNFVLGFKKGTSEVVQFVARDVGDTCWHDRYLHRYFEGNDRSKAAFEKFKREEDAKDSGPNGDNFEFYCLERTSDTDYPAPFIVRLAANAVLTHQFGDVLKTHHWKEAQLYEFTTGILDGFWSYFREAFQWDEPPRAPDMERFAVDSLIKLYGVNGKYPPGTTSKEKNDYKNRVEAALRLEEARLFGSAAQIRRRGRDLKPDEYAGFKGSGQDNHICTLINAEEILLCAAIEKKLGTWTGGVRNENIANRIQELLTGQWPKVIP